MPTRMSSTSTNAARQRTPRRKIALACEPCRAKKVRCDGAKPICGPCTKRSYSIEQCLYSADNSRSASQDEYIRVLHNRIRELEQACSRTEALAPALNHHESRTENIPLVRSPTGQEGAMGVESNSARAAISQYPDVQSVPSQSSVETHRRSATTTTSATQSSPVAGGGSPLFDSLGHVTGMGQISAPEVRLDTQTSGKEFYGASSTASLMRLARASMPFNSSLRTSRESNPSSGPVGIQFYEPPTQFRFEDFALPPRALADHLLECFWNHIYYLYPLFDRPSFEAAYENLWKSDKEPMNNLLELNIGLGGKPDSGPKSIVFHCALNTMFALGCYFSEIPIEEREASAYSFFLRNKRFVGLDMLEINTIGVVQTFLLTALYLQASPYPHRCCNSIGVSRRIAQGLGLHEPNNPYPMDPLECEIRRRTWHGCVIMDTFVSMTYGRPSMTSHLASVPLPCSSDFPPEAHEAGRTPSTMKFYIATIELYKILDNILSEVYNAWRALSRQGRTSPVTHGPENFDTLIELERRLCTYESSLPSFLNWTVSAPIETLSADHSVIIERQRNVLHGRYNYLRLLLYRPTFTQLCSEANSPERRSMAGRSQEADMPRGKFTENVLYSCMTNKCAVACVLAAVELIQLVYDTYWTPTADAWWYNGFYVSTAATVLIMSYSIPQILDSATRPRTSVVQASWNKCEKVLSHMATFSQSARNTLNFLQAAHNSQVVSGAPNEGSGSGRSSGNHVMDGNIGNNTRLQERDLPPQSHNTARCGGQYSGVTAQEQQYQQHQHQQTACTSTHVCEPTIVLSPPANHRNHHPMQDQGADHAFEDFSTAGLGPDEFGFLSWMDTQDIPGWLVGDLRGGGLQ